MTTSKRIEISCLALAILLGACNGNGKPQKASAILKDKVDHTLSRCGFKTADINQDYCQVSLYALIVNSDQYVGKKIFTYGYLVKDNNNAYGLYLEPRFRKVPDAVSCISIEAPSLSTGIPDMKPLEFYSVALGGNFTSRPGFICSGVLSDVEISAAAREQFP